MPTWSVKFRRWVTKGREEMAKSKLAPTPLPHHVAIANELHLEIFDGCLLQRWLAALS